MVRFEPYGPWKTVYNHFNRWSQPRVINVIFNKLLSYIDAHGLVYWTFTALDGNNILALKCAPGAQKNIPISLEISAQVAHAVVMAPKSIWQQMEAVSLKYRAEPGQTHKNQFALRLLDDIGVQRQNGNMKYRGCAVLVAKAYWGRSCWANPSDMRGL